MLISFRRTVHLSPTVSARFDASFACEPRVRVCLGCLAKTIARWRGNCLHSSHVRPSEIAVRHPDTCQLALNAEAMLHHTGMIVLNTFLVHSESGESPRGEEFGGCFALRSPRSHVVS